MKEVVATLCLACVFLVVGLTGCEEAPKKTPTNTGVKAPPTKAEKKKPAEQTKIPPTKAEEKKGGEKTKAPPAKAEEKKPAAKTEAPPAKTEETEVAQAPKGETKPAAAENKTVLLKPIEGEKEKPAPPPKPVLLSFDAEQKVWTIDDFEKESKWQVEAWAKANPATVSVVEGTGGKVLQVVCEAGDGDKSAISRSLPINMTGRSKLLVDVRSGAEKEIGLAIAFLTQGNVFFESKPTVVKPGLTKDVAFDLKAETFKSAATEWAHTAALAGVDQVKTFYFVIYSGAGEVSFDNLRLVAE